MHTAGQFQPGERGDAAAVQFAVSTYESNLSIQIWKSYSDEIDIQIVHPGGLTAGPIQQLLGTQRFRMQQTEFCFIMANQVHIVHIRKYFWNFCQQTALLTAGYGRSV